MPENVSKPDGGSGASAPLWQRLLAALLLLLPALLPTTAPESLINDILDLSKIEAGRITLFLEELEVAKLVDEVASTVRPLVAKNTNSLVVECAPDLGVMKADATKVRQTLFNLPSNACKFTARGVIRLQVTAQRSDLGDPGDQPAAPSDRPDRSDSSELSDRARTTVLAVDDDTTVRDLVQRSLTKDGYRVVTAADGSRGLALAREERPSVITLDVMMPGMDGWAVLTGLKCDPAAAAIPVVMMTIIDDDPDPRDRLRRGMEKDGWTVAEAANGRLGLEAIAGGSPSLILLDLMRPGMDGFIFLEELRRRSDARSIPVIVITAKDLTEDERRRLNGEVARVLQKGAISTDELLAAIRSHIPAP